MAIRYFFKGLVNQNVVLDRAGRSIKWEQLPGKQGVIALDEDTQKELVEDLVGTVGKRGVIEINEHRYGEVKKKSLSAKFARKENAFGGQIKVLQNQLPAPRKSPAPSAVAASAPLEPPPANTKLPGGDTALAAASVPPAKPQPRLAAARPMRFEGQPVPVIPAQLAPAPKPVSAKSPVPVVQPAIPPVMQVLGDAAPPAQVAATVAAIQSGAIKAPAKRGRPRKSVPEPVAA